MQELFCLLTEKTKQGIENLNLNHLQEIRLRVGKPVCVLYCFENYFLTSKGLSKISKDAIVPTQNEVENTLLKACQHSLHTFSHQLSKGFVMPFGGLRIGVCGCVVVQDEKVVSIKEISSLNIRLPHEIKDCSKEYCRYLLNPVKNILIISPPGGGKTTFLRDLIYQTSLCEKALNVLVADERNEIAGCIDGIAQFDLGTFCDIVSMAKKDFAFKCAIRTMTPDILACDEICNDDFDFLYDISKNGINLFCTMHGQGIEDVLKNVNPKIRHIFDRYVILSNKNSSEKTKGVFDKDFNRLDI